MKKSKLLLLVLVTPLLTGCGNKVKAPKFAKEGEAVAGDKFTEDMSKALASSAFAQDAALPSAVMEVKEQNLYVQEVLRGGKSFTKSTTSGEEAVKLQYDANNSIVRMDNNSNAKYQSKSNHGKTDEKESSKQTRSYEGAQVSGANYLVMIDSDAKEYSPVALIEGETTVAKAEDLLMKAMMASVVGEYVLTQGQWAGMSEEEQAKYKLFENGNVYTCTYESKVENEEIKDAEDKVLRIESSKTLSKAQIDFTAGKLAIKAYSEVETSITYKQSIGSYAVDDVATTKRVTAFDATYNDKDVKLKATDLSKYVAINF